MTDNAQAQTEVNPYEGAKAGNNVAAMGPYRRDVRIDGAINEKLVDHALFMGAQYLYGMGVDGNVIEFGTMTGSTAAVLAASVAVHNDVASEKRALWLCDSFEGLPKSDASEDITSPHVQSGVWGPGTCKDMDLEQLAARIATTGLPAEHLHIVKGWFRDTIPSIEAKFGLLHVDCDLYQSTIDALTPLFRKGRITQGALILFDDWNCNRAALQHGQRAAWRELIQKYHIVCSDEGGYGIAGHKFIVHNYMA